MLRFEGAGEERTASEHACCDWWVPASADGSGMIQEGGTDCCKRLIRMTLNVTINVTLQKLRLSANQTPPSCL